MRPKTKFNPLKVDPTRLATVRRAFSTEVLRALSDIRSAILKLVVEEDAFGLRRTPFSFNERFAFETSAGKVKRFRQWVREQTDLKLTGRGADELWSKYIEQGYKKGFARSYDDSNKKVKSKAFADSHPTRLTGVNPQASILPRGGLGVPVKGHFLGGVLSGPTPFHFYQASKEQYLARAFSKQATTEKVKLLAGRTFSEMDGLSSKAATKMSRALADGLVRGSTPEEIGDALVCEIDLAKSQAMTIVRTELTRAHAEGQLDALESLGHENVIVAVEWSTAHDSKVCELCEPLGGIVLKLSEARGMLPRHPNCRCAWSPVGEETGEDTRTGKKAIDRAIKSSLEEGDQTEDDWGPGRSISSRRPV